MNRSFRFRFRKAAAALSALVILVAAGAAPVRGAQVQPAHSAAGVSAGIAGTSAGTAGTSAEAAGTSAGGNGRGGSLASPAVTGPLTVRGTQLCGSDGSPAVLRGISTHGLQWFPQYVNRELFRELRTDWGLNAVRLALYTEEGGYCASGPEQRERLKALVLQGVQAAKEADLYVIVDWHILSDGNPNAHAEEAARFFGEIGGALGDTDHVLYEICNEPNGGTSWQEIRRYAERVMPVIRQFDPDAVILVGTPQWSQLVEEAAANPLQGYGNVMYTLHFYADTHREWLRQSAERALDAGLPLFVSEFGICDASGSGALNTKEGDAWMRFLSERGVSSVYWNLCNKAETSAVISPACQKVSGFTEEDLSPAGVWLRHSVSQ